MTTRDKTGVVVFLGDISLDSDIVKIGSEFDYLAKSSPDASQVRAFPARPELKIGVVVSVRNEGLGILEWLAHYRVLGVSAIFVYTNDNTDGSDELLRLLHQHGVIRLRFNQTAPEVSPQMKAFRHALWCCPETAQCEWLSFLDADEFVIPKFKGRFIASFERYLRLMGKDFDASCICLNWKWFSGGLEYRRTKGLCLEKFSTMRLVSTVKTLFKPRAVESFENLHYVTLKKRYKTIGGTGLPIKNAGIKAIPGDDFGQVNHYWQKSFQEYYLKKTRGRGAMGLAGVQRSYDEFFQWWTVGVPEFLPGSEHIDLVVAEMARLHALPGIADAVATIEANFKARVEQATELPREYLRARKRWDAWETRRRVLAAKKQPAGVAAAATRAEEATAEVSATSGQG